MTFSTLRRVFMRPSSFFFFRLFVSIILSLCSQPCKIVSRPVISYTWVTTNSVPRHILFGIQHLRFCERTTHTRAHTHTHTLTRYVYTTNIHQESACRRTEYEHLLPRFHFAAESCCYCLLLLLLLEIVAVVKWWRRCLVCSPRYDTRHALDADGTRYTTTWWYNTS